MADMWQRDPEKDGAVWDTPAGSRRDVDQWETAYSPAADLLDLLERWTPEWMRKGACKGETEIFFPSRGDTPVPAKVLCGVCPVREECLEFALDNREKFGVWGGMSERQRRKIRKQRDISGHRCGTREGYFVHLRKKEPACSSCVEAERLGDSTPPKGALSPNAVRRFNDRTKLRRQGWCPACAQRSHNQCHGISVACACPSCAKKEAA